MDSFNGTLNGTQIHTLATVYLVSLSFSLIGSCSVLVVSLAKWRHLQQQVRPLLVQLTLADFLAALTLIFTSSINFIHPGTAYFNQTVTICEHTLPLALMFYCVSFLLVMLYAWEFQHAMERWREKPAEHEEAHCRRRVKAASLYVVVWCIPIVLYLVYVGTPFITTSSLLPASRQKDEASVYCTSCILFLHIWSDPCSDDEEIHDIFIRSSLFFSVILVLVCCTVLYHKIGRWYRRYQEEGHFLPRTRVEGAFSSARCMVLVIIVCWAPALLLVVLSVIRINQQKLFPLYLIQAGTVSLQGCLNSVIYAWRRRDFREAVQGERMPLIQAPLAFFDQSLSGLNT